MLSYERHQQILNLLKEHRCATVELLSSRLYTSPATIRRDLSVMAEKGLVTRIRGGAALTESTNQDAPPLLRVNKEREKKERIAQLALPLLRDGNTVFLDSSTTVSTLAEKFSSLRGLSVMSNGIAAINLLNEKTSAKVFTCGGVIQNQSSVVGQLAVRTVDAFHADLFFFSCCGLSLRCGTTEASEEAAAVKRAMFRNADKRVLLCDSTKFGLEFFCKSCELSQVDVIVTDRKPEGGFLQGVSCKVLY